MNDQSLCNSTQAQLPGIGEYPQPDSDPVPNSMVCGDSRAVMRRMPANSVHLVVTSPPYWDLVDYGFEGQIGQTAYEVYLNDMLEVWAECERVLVPNGKLCINVPIVPVPKERTPDIHTRDLKNLANDIEHTILAELTLRRYSLFVWQKQTTEKMFGSYPYPPNIYENNTIEFINVYVKPGKPRKLSSATKEASRLSQSEWMDLTRQVWWIYPEDVTRSGNHPAPFPVLLPARLIRMYTFAAVPEESFPGDVILDPFVGSGSACVAAKMLGRRYIGIDGAEGYVRYAKQRVQTTSVNLDYDIHLRKLSDGDQELEARKEHCQLTMLE